MNSRQVLKTYVQSSLETGLLNPSEVVNATHEAVADYYSQRLTPPFCIPFSEPDRTYIGVDWGFKDKPLSEQFYRINVAEQYRRQCEAYVRQLVRQELDRFKDEQGHVDVPHLLDRVIRLESELGFMDPVNKVESLVRHVDAVNEDIDIRLTRLTDHVNREIGVAQDEPLHARLNRQLGTQIELPAVCDRLNRIEQNHNNFASYMGRELQRLEKHFQDLIQMLTKKFTRRIRRRKEK